ncbi:hypothetical protein AOX55_0000756 [Sinorhizobium fredii CCBAU 25509]|nr:hypothetical protein AOX55_0000756 [Sinorhizobium fredii CCBAU 25509]
MLIETFELLLGSAIAAVERTHSDAGGRCGCEIGGQAVRADT